MFLLKNTLFLKNNEFNPIINENISYIQFNSINEKPKPTLKVSIAKKKVTKIKTRIIKTFLDFGKNKNFELLKKRIKFLISINSHIYLAVIHQITIQFHQLRSWPSHNS